MERLFSNTELKAIQRAMEEFQVGILTLERAGINVELQADLYDGKGKLGAVLNGMLYDEEEWFLDVSDKTAN